MCVEHPFLLHEYEAACPQSLLRVTLCDFFKNLLKMHCCRGIGQIYITFVLWNTENTVVQLLLCCHLWKLFILFIGKKFHAFGTFCQLSVKYSFVFYKRTHLVLRAFRQLGLLWTFYCWLTGHDASYTSEIKGYRAESRSLLECSRDQHKKRWLLLPHTIYCKGAGTSIFFLPHAPQLHENNMAQHKNCIIKLFWNLLQAVVMAKESIENAFNSTIFQWALKNVS